MIIQTPADKSVQTEHRVKWKLLLTLTGLIGSLAITVALRWTNALTVATGLVFPVVLGIVLARISHYRLRFPGLVGLGVTLVSILVICWVARYPNPNKAFADAMGMQVPQGVQNLQAKRGWFDGPITVLRFTAKPEVIRPIIPPREKVQRLDQYPYMPVEQQWHAAVMAGSLIDSSLRPYPGWKKPCRSSWLVPKESIDPKSISVVWDEETGNAIICVSE